jgi:hypothetical protein
MVEVIGEERVNGRGDGVGFFLEGEVTRVE